jgi:hypothetical protein
MTCTKIFGSTLAICVIGTTIFAEKANATLAFDANLINGVYYGSGNINGGFTIDTDNGVELGLRAKTLDPNGSNQVINTPTDVYDVPDGLSPFKAGRAAWNWDVSIDILGGPDTAISQLTATLTITDTITSSQIVIDPINGLGGDATLGTTGVQNSENPLFAVIFPAGYSVNSLDPYRFDLTVSDANGNVESDTIFVDPQAPEPSTIGLVLSGGLVLFLRRRSLGLLRK